MDKYHRSDAEMMLHLKELNILKFMSTKPQIGGLAEKGILNVVIPYHPAVMYVCGLLMVMRVR